MMAPANAGAVYPLIGTSHCPTIHVTFLDVCPTRGTTIQITKPIATATTIHVTKTLSSQRAERATANPLQMGSIQQTVIALCFLSAG